MGRINVVHPDLDLVISQHDLALLRAHLPNRKDTVAKLIENIIHEWAIHPARLQGNVPLPTQTSVLLQGETLRSYIHRVAQVVIQVVHQKERRWVKTAAYLGYERTAFAKLCSRLKNGKGPPAFHLALGNESEGLLPLPRVIREHVTNALHLCNGNQEEACHVLCVSLSQLNLIGLIVQTETEADLLKRFPELFSSSADNQCLSKPE